MAEAINWRSLGFRGALLRPVQLQQLVDVTVNPGVDLDLADGRGLHVASLLSDKIYSQGERSPYCIFLMVLDRSARARQLAQERVRRTAGELTEVLDEVRLIDVSAIGRQIGPRNRMHRLIIGLRDLDIRFAHTLVRSRAAQPVE